MPTAGICKAKRSGLSVLWSAHVVDEDHFGTWLAASTGTRVAWKGDPSQADKETVASLDIVVLMPTSGWWVASWWSNGDITVDIALPPSFSGGLWTFEDLELDLFLTPSGSHGVVDVDEFLAECDSGQIYVDERGPALQAAGAIERVLKSRAEPFGAVGWSRCREADALHLPLLDPPV